MIFDGVSAATGDVTSQSASSQAKLEEELNQFLNLLITQLKNQDPLDPLDANEFTSQLVQFASVEQQIYQNANLEKLLNLTESSQVASMVSYLGTTVEATAKKVPLENGEARFTYALGVNAADVTITLQNSSGLTVFTADGDAGAGAHTFTWDGKSADGIAQPDGAYTVTVTAQDRSGDLMDVEQTIFGRVTGAGVDDGRVSLSMGDVVVSMEDVLAVEETKTTVAEVP